MSEHIAHVVRFQPDGDDVLTAFCTRCGKELERQSDYNSSCEESKLRSENEKLHASLDLERRFFIFMQNQLAWQLYEAQQKLETAERGIQRLVAVARRSRPRIQGSYHLWHLFPYDKQMLWFVSDPDGKVIGRRSGYRDWNEAREFAIGWFEDQRIQAQNCGM